VSDVVSDVVSGGSVAAHSQQGDHRSDDAADTARVDAWLWSVRLFRTRSDATAACRAGKVQINGRPAKAASTVTAGDRVRGRIRGDQRDVEVVRAVRRRVGAAVAAECLVDHAPPPPSPSATTAAGGPGATGVGAARDGADLSEAVARRDRGSGRPTKRDRRRIDRLTGRTD